MLCRVHKDERIVEVIFTGLVTKEIALSELKNLYDQLRAQQVSGYHLLVDLIRAEGDIVFAEMMDVVHLLRKQTLGFEKIGVLCETPLNYGTSRMFQLLYREKQSNIKIDSSRESLISWMMSANTP
jgi:hypothetical protein